MLSASLPRKVVLSLLLLTVVASPLAWAAEVQPPKAATPLSPLDLLDRLWDLLASAWGEEACTEDPDGRCITPQTDEGCHIDPDGRCGS